MSSMKHYSRDIDMDLPAEYKLPPGVLAFIVISGVIMIIAVFGVIGCFSRLVADDANDHEEAMAVQDVVATVVRFHSVSRFLVC